MANSKKNYYISDETDALIEQEGERRKLSKGKFVEYLVEQYMAGVLVQKHTDEEILSLVRTTKKMVDEMSLMQNQSANVLNTICAINDYDNFQSIEDNPSFAFQEARKYAKAKRNADIVKSLNKQKANQYNGE